MCDDVQSKTLGEGVERHVDVCMDDRYVLIHLHLTIDGFLPTPAFRRKFEPDRYYLFLRAYSSVEGPAPLVTAWCANMEKALKDAAEDALRETGKANDTSRDVCDLLRCISLFVCARAWRERGG